MLTFLILKQRDLKFSISPKRLNHADCYNNSELFHIKVFNLDDMSNQNLDFVKAKIKDAVLTLLL